MDKPGAREITYGSRVGVRNAALGRYIATLVAQGAASELDVDCSGSHPFRRAQSAAHADASEWTVLRFDHRESRGPLRYGDTVVLAKTVAGTAGAAATHGLLAVSPDQGVGLEVLPQPSAF